MPAVVDRRPAHEAVGLAARRLGGEPEDRRRGVFLHAGAGKMPPARPAMKRQGVGVAEQLVRRINRCGVSRVDEMQAHLPLDLSIVVDVRPPLQHATGPVGDGQPRDATLVLLLVDHAAVALDVAFGILRTRRARCRSRQASRYMRSRSATFSPLPDTALICPRTSAHSSGFRVAAGLHRLGDLGGGRQRLRLGASAEVADQLLHPVARRQQGIARGAAVGAADGGQRLGFGAAVGDVTRDQLPLGAGLTVTGVAELAGGRQQLGVAAARRSAARQVSLVRSGSRCSPVPLTVLLSFHGGIISGACRSGCRSSQAKAS
ncbi:MAG: hypothetical protein IPK19_37975 [Chloroflexi bacterium]|nr:hypothetical protein [Chloroflexota bacterium]